jgi:hypothetical protein
MSGSPSTSVVSLSAIAICAIVTFSATTLASQAAPTVVVAVSQLRPGETVRVATSDRAVLEGHFARLESDSLVLYSAAGRNAPHISLVQIDSLWSHGHNHAKGFLIGALIGGVVGGVGVAILALSITHSTSEHCNCGDTVAGTVGVSAVLGGLVGAAIGWPGWRQRWPQ